MIMIGLMERFWKKAYRGLTVFRYIMTAPSMIVIFPLMAILAIVEMIILDIVWLVFDCIDTKKDAKYWNALDSIRWLTW